MSNTAKLAISASIDVVLGLMFYLWQIEGMDQAGHVFLFWVWFVGIIGLLALGNAPEAEDYRPEPAVYSICNYLVNVAVVLAAAWTGHEIAAALYAWAVLVSYARHTLAKRLAEAAK